MAFKQIAGGKPPMGTLGSTGGAPAGSQHANRNHTPLKMGNTGSFDMGRKQNAGGRHGSAAGEHTAGKISGRKSHAAGEGGC